MDTIPSTHINEKISHTDTDLTSIFFSLTTKKLSNSNQLTLLHQNIAGL